MLPGIYDSFQHWGEKHQTVWIYSDPHFNDDELAGGIRVVLLLKSRLRKLTQSAVAAMPSFVLATLVM